MATRERILAVATKEFSERGVDGARIDEIVRLSDVSKNLIYHYFDSKELLFIAVLESAYSTMHKRQQEWPVAGKRPADNIQAFVRLLFDYWKESPEIIGLLNSEIFHKGRHLKKTPMISRGYEAMLKSLTKVLAEGQRSGAFRKDTDAIELYLTISSLCYHYFSNRCTLSILLGRDLSAPRQMSARLQHIEDVILSYLQFPARASK